MKFVKKLMLGDRACKIVSESVVLDLTSPGRAVFCIQAASAETGTPVRFFLGSDGTAELWFTGYVESVRKLDAQQVTQVKNRSGIASVVPAPASSDAEPT